MFQVLGIQELYIGCLGIGFLYVAGSLMLTGVHTGQAGSRIAGARSARMIRTAASTRGSTARVAVRGAASARSANARASIKSGRAATSTRGSNTRSGRTPGSKAQQDAQFSSPPTDGQHQSASMELRENTFVRCSKNDGQAESDLIERLYFAIMGIFNPMSISTCLFFFGLSGLIIIRVTHGLPQSSLVPALILALILSAQMQKVLAMFASKLENSALQMIDSAIGLVGEISVSIPAGRTGEVVFVLGQCRRNYSAKGADCELGIPSGTKVLIVDVDKNFAYVEPFDDVFDN